MKILFYLGLICLSSCTINSNIEAPELLTGKQLAFTRSKGNCLACHAIEDGDSPGNIGPPLADMQSRFDSRMQLRQQIWDATKFNPDTSMPPYGKNRILTESEIDKVVDYIWNLK